VSVVATRTGAFVVISVSWPSCDRSSCFLKDAAQAEALEENIVDAATAAQSAAELAVEIALLDELVALAYRVRDAGQDCKWAELRRLLIVSRAGGS